MRQFRNKERKGKMYKEVEEIGPEDMQAAADMFDRLVIEGNKDKSIYISATRILEKTFRLQLQNKIINPTVKNLLVILDLRTVLEKSKS